MGLCSTNGKWCVRLGKARRSRALSPFERDYRAAAMSGCTSQRGSRTAAGLLMLLVAFLHTSLADAVNPRAVAPAPSQEPSAAASSDAAAALITRCRAVSTPAYEPVCAANVTYINGDWARCATAGGPATQGPCAQAPLAMVAMSTCSEKHCASEPFASVCGVDGQTYTNACVATCAGLGWTRGQCCTLLCVSCAYARRLTPPLHVAVSSQGQASGRHPTTAAKTMRVMTAR